MSPGPICNWWFRCRRNIAIPCRIIIADLPLYDRLYHPRSDIPAVAHVDFSAARIHPVHRETNERYWRLIAAFKNLTGWGLLINMNFNVRGGTPEDAYRCFMRTEMDWLVVNDTLFSKAEQPPWQDAANWQDLYKLD